MPLAIRILLNAVLLNLCIIAVAPALFNEPGQVVPGCNIHDNTATTRSWSERRQAER